MLHCFIIFKLKGAASQGILGVSKTKTPKTQNLKTKTPHTVFLPDRAITGILRYIQRRPPEKRRKGQFSPLL